MNTIGIADNLINKFTDYFPEEKLSDVLEETLSQEEIKKLNKVLAEKFLKSVV